MNVYITYIKIDLNLVELFRKYKNYDSVKLSEQEYSEEIQNDISNMKFPTQLIDESKEKKAIDEIRKRKKIQIDKNVKLF